MPEITADLLVFYEELAELVTEKALLDWEKQRRNARPSHMMFILEAAAEHTAFRQDISVVAARQLNPFNDERGRPLAAGWHNEWDASPGWRKEDEEERKEAERKAEEEKRKAEAERQRAEKERRENEMVLQRLGITAEDVEVARRVKAEKAQKAERPQQGQGQANRQGAAEGRQHGQSGGNTVAGARPAPPAPHVEPNPVPIQPAQAQVPVVRVPILPAPVLPQAAPPQAQAGPSAPQMPQASSSASASASVPAQPPRWPAGFARFGSAGATSSFPSGSSAQTAGQQSGGSGVKRERDEEGEGNEGSVKRSRGVVKVENVDEEIVEVDKDGKALEKPKET
jgi:hypothetical protein